jgi:hypothetical protein
LSTSSYVYWPFVFLLFVHSVHLPIYSLICRFFERLDF